MDHGGSLVLRHSDVLPHNHSPVVKGRVTGQVTQQALGGIDCVTSYKDAVYMYFKESTTES